MGSSKLCLGSKQVKHLCNSPERRMLWTLMSLFICNSEYLSQKCTCSVHSLGVRAQKTYVTTKLPLKKKKSVLPTSSALVQCWTAKTFPHYHVVTLLALIKEVKKEPLCALWQIVVPLEMGRHFFLFRQPGRTKNLRSKIFSPNVSKIFKESV